MIHKIAICALCAAAWIGSGCVHPRSLPDGVHSKDAGQFVSCSGDFRLGNRFGNIVGHEGFLEAPNLGDSRSVIAGLHRVLIEDAGKLISRNPGMTSFTIAETNEPIWVYISTGTCAVESATTTNEAMQRIRAKCTDGSFLAPVAMTFDDGAWRWTIVRPEQCSTVDLVSNIVSIKYAYFAVPEHTAIESVEVFRTVEN